MPVSLSEWRVRIGTYVPCVLQFHKLVSYQTQLLFLTLLETTAEGEINVGPSNKQEMGTPLTIERQSSMYKTSSKSEKDGSSCGGSDEQETPMPENTKAMPCKTSKNWKRHSHKASDASHLSSGTFMSFCCFMKLGASPLLQFMLLVYAAILLVRSGDVEVNPGPNENPSLGIDSLTILNIAGAIWDDNKILRLGHHLGNAEAAIHRYLAMNRMNGRVTSDGTREMLEEWQERTGGDDQHGRLRRALENSDLRNVADQFIPADPSSESARQSSSLEMPDSNAPNIPPQSQPNPNQQPYPNYMPYYPLHQYAASSANQGVLPYQGIYYPFMMLMPVVHVPPVFPTQVGFSPLNQVEPQGGQFQDQRLQPSHPLSYGQSAPHALNSPASFVPPTTEEPRDGKSCPTCHQAVPIQVGFSPPVQVEPEGWQFQNQRLQPNHPTSNGQSAPNALNSLGSFGPHTTEELGQEQRRALEDGNPPYRRSRMMVDGPAGDGETSPICCRRSGQEREITVGLLTINTLYNLAENIGNDTNLTRLAIHLGFRKTKAMFYKASNTRRDGTECSEGTLSMLMDWTKKTPTGSPISILKKALYKTVMEGLAEQYLTDAI